MARSPVRAFIIIFLLGFSIRVFFLTKIPEGHILPHDRWEDTAIATSLVERGEFADPYMIPTGPTAHLPPLVPGVLALMWSVFGMGLVGGYAAYLFSIAAFSALYALLPWFGGKFGPGREAGVLGGIVGSLIVLRPGNAEELAAIVLGLLAIAFLRRWTSGLGSYGGSLLLGAACGVAFHLQPVLLPVVLGWMAFELWWSRDRRKWYLSGVMVLGLAIACAPWGWRNYTVFDEVFFIRGDLGLELRMGNHDGAAGAIEKIGAWEEYRHPRTHPVEARLVQELGEAGEVSRIDGLADNAVLARTFSPTGDGPGGHGPHHTRAAGCVALAAGDDTPATGGAHDAADLLPADLLRRYVHAPLQSAVGLDSATAGRRRGLALAQGAVKIIGFIRERGSGAALLVPATLP
jgi:hypothetical protein